MSNQNQPQNKPAGSLKVQGVQYSGPIPPPAMLEQYDKIVPGAAERLLRMAEEQSAHRRSLEKKAIDTDSRNSTMGIASALLISLSAFCVVVYAIIVGQIEVAKLVAGGVIVSLVSAFIYGTRSRRLERQARLKQD